MQFLQKIPPWCDKMPKINLRDRGFIGLRKWNLGVVTSREELSEELSETDDRSSGNLAHIAMEIAKYQKDLDEAEERWLELAA